MDFLISSTFRQLPRSPQPGSIYVEQNFTHRGGSISVEGSSAENGGAVLWSSSGVAGDGSGFGVWKDTCGVAEMCGF